MKTLTCFAATLAVLCLAPALLASTSAPGAPAQQPAQPVAPTQQLLAPASGSPSQAKAPGTDDDVIASLDQRGVNQCIEITVWAKNPDTGECREFPNPCSVPSGWQIFFDPTTCANG
jgi:hypothetical protein